MNAIPMQFWLCRNPTDKCTDMHVYSNKPLWFPKEGIHAIEYSAYESLERQIHMMTEDIAHWLIENESLRIKYQRDKK